VYLLDDIEFRYRIAAEYTLGLCWVLRYYYQGCASWKWYFPYHYAPFASDFINIGDVKNEFEADTKPFKPLEQLMSVFPALSRQHVPLPWGELMLDPYGPIIDFYPSDFKIDLNGKKYAWQGVALVPFVDSPLLLFILAAIFIGIPTGNVMALTVETVPAEHRNTGTGLYHTWNHAGLFVGPALAGWIVTQTGDPATAMFFGGTTMALAIVVLGALRALQWREARAG
jgi:hypothetical protein